MTDRIPTSTRPAFCSVARRLRLNVGAQQNASAERILTRMIEPPHVHRFAETGQVPDLTASTASAVRDRSTTTNTRVCGEGISELFRNRTCAAT